MNLSNTRLAEEVKTLQEELRKTRKRIVELQDEVDEAKGPASTKVQQHHPWRVTIAILREALAGIKRTVLEEVHAACKAVQNVGDGLSAKKEWSPESRLLDLEREVELLKLDNKRLSAAVKKCDHEAAHQASSMQSLRDKNTLLDVKIRDLKKQLGMKKGAEEALQDQVTKMERRQAIMRTLATTQNEPKKWRRASRPRAGSPAATIGPNPPVPPSPSCTRDAPLRTPTPRQPSPAELFRGLQRAGVKAFEIES
eukprot:TRINITY_DN18445_c0_g1_i1.p1 TRINITY_DN18445_c0_g1~~TRINITY_DN18445_c0_g1_i1.p1  ORF type:complete len:254 (+),score=46.06 TRINITY_DN18445_c0_g1_i1:179-940(+)